MRRQEHCQVGATPNTMSAGSSWQGASSIWQLEIGVSETTLETRSSPLLGWDHLDQKDHGVLQKLHSQNRVPASFKISHDDMSEVLLGLADILAGARTDSLAPSAPSGA